MDILFLLMKICIALTFFATIWAIIIYNRFVLLKRQKDEAWSGILVQLQLRHDLVPQLVDVVKAYTAHERQILEDVITLRSFSLKSSLPLIQEKEHDLGHALGRLFAVVEQYPVLKSSQNYQDLFAALVKIEDDIQYARRYYNGTVRNYNILVDSFPSIFIARIFDYQESLFFELESPEFAQQPGVNY